MVSVVSTRTAAELGAGAVDYTKPISGSVESMIGASQTGYAEDDTMTVAAGTTETKIYTLTSDHVVIIYDLYASCEENCDLRFKFETYSSGSWVELHRGYGNRYVRLNLIKGFPCFDQIRLSVQNNGAVPATVYLCWFGIETSEDEYNSVWQNVVDWKEQA